jgi:hypothetical protein
MKLFRLLSLLLPALFLFSSCNTVKVATDYDKSVDFSKFKTYSFIKLKVTENVSPLNQQRIVNSVKAELKKKGFTETEENPDLLVNTTAILQDKKSVTANTYGYGGYYRPYGWGAGYGGGTTTFDVYEYKNGSLIIDIIDAKSNQLIWQGTGNKEIDSPSKYPDQDIANAVAKIMYGFPPVKK